MAREGFLVPDDQFDQALAEGRLKPWLNELSAEARIEGMRKMFANVTYVRNLAGAQERSKRELPDVPA